MNNYSLIGNNENNYIDINEGVNASKLTIEIKGTGNKITIDECCILNETFIRFGVTIIMFT